MFFLQPVSWEPLVLEDWEDFIASWPGRPLAPLPFEVRLQGQFGVHDAAQVIVRADPERAAPVGVPLNQWAAPVGVPLNQWAADDSDQAQLPYRQHRLLSEMRKALLHELLNLVARTYALTQQFPVVGDSFHVEAGAEGQERNAAGELLEEEAARGKRWSGAFVLVQKTIATTQTPGGLSLWLRFEEIGLPKGGDTLTLVLADSSPASGRAATAGGRGSELVAEHASHRLMNGVLRARQQGLMEGSGPYEQVTVADLAAVNVKAFLKLPAVGQTTLLEAEALCRSFGLTLTGRK